MTTDRGCDSPTSLTVFAPLSPEAKPSGGFFSRLFKRNNDDKEGTPESLLSSSSDHTSDNVLSSDPSDSNLVDVTDASEDDPSSPEGQSATPQRTLTGVLKRLTSVLDRRGQTPQAYKDSDFRQYWMPDSNCKECYECGDRFNTFRRRHHCRVCGQIFCSRCCNQEVPGKIMGYTGYLRVCTYCCRIVLKYAQSTDSSVDLQSLCEEMKHLDEGEHPRSVATNWHSPQMARKNRGPYFVEETFKRSGSSPDLTVIAISGSVFDVTQQSDITSLDMYSKERKMLTQDSAQLKHLSLLIQHPVEGVEMQTHRYRLRTVNNCIVGSELVDWLILKDKAATRVQAVAIGQALLDAQYLECVTQAEAVFKDEYALYRIGMAAVKQSTLFRDSTQDSLCRLEEDSEPDWFRDIPKDEYDNVSVTELEEDHEPVVAERAEETVHPAMTSDPTSLFYVDPPDSLQELRKKKQQWGLMSDTSDTDQYEVIRRQDSSTQSITDDFFNSGLGFASSTEGHELDGRRREEEELQEENGERLANTRIMYSLKEHMAALVHQLVNKEGLSSKWVEIILGMANKISTYVTPNVRVDHDDMNIIKYVQIKKIPGGQRSQSCIIRGVVCTKNVAHKKMRTNILNPKILLLQGAIEYQRVENKYSSLEPQILQEHEFLGKLTRRIAELTPDILLVEKTVSRVAQEYLMDSGITFVLNIKPSVMQRVARLTQADIVTSVDTLVSKTSLGQCYRFYVQFYELPKGRSKTLMYLEGCPFNLGCTITLRGGTNAELVKVKKILQFMIYALYHGRLESSFLMDEFAMPPPVPEEQPDLHIHDDQEKGSSVGMTLSSSFDVLEKENTKMVVEKESNPVLNNVGALDTSNKGLLSPPVECSNSRSPSPSPKKPKRMATMDSVSVDDQSDPLHNYQNSKDDSIFESTDSLKEEVKRAGHKIKKILNDIHLTISPYIKHAVPYLETEAGSTCKLRKYFPADLYWSSHLSDSVSRVSRKLTDSRHSSSVSDSSVIQFMQPHAFISTTVTEMASHINNQALLADFRACGGQIQFKQDLREAEWNIHRRKPLRQDSEKEQNGGDKSVSGREKIDCMDTDFHQHIAVLFSSFSYESANAPNPCVYPWVVNMDFYGRNDLTLGGFLDKYCFRESYSCPNGNCETPMVDHIRRFVHSQACLQIIMKRLDTEMPRFQDSILMWGWCKRCKQVTPVVPMSADTWSMSFAKYLELRLYGWSYGRRASAEPCEHSLHHDHFQYFGYKHIVASFKYTTIILQEVVLPPEVTDLQEETKMPEGLIDEVQMLNVKGTGAFSSIQQALFQARAQAQNEHQTILIAEYLLQLQADKDNYMLQRDSLQVLSQQALDEGGSSLLYRVRDSLVNVKRLVAEAVAHWNIRLHELEQIPKKLEKAKGPNTMMSIPKTNRDVTCDQQYQDFPSQGSGEEEYSFEPPDGSTVTDKAAIHVAGPRFTSLRKSGSGANLDQASWSGSNEDKNTAANSQEDAHSLTAATDLKVSGSPKQELENATEQAVHNFRGHKRSNSYGDSRGYSRDVTDKVETFKKGTSKKNIFSSFLSSSEAATIHMPFPADEHYLLPVTVKVPVVIYDQEPSSIIAYALSTNDYEKQLQDLKAGRVKEGTSAGKKLAGQSLDQSVPAEPGAKKGSGVLAFLKGGAREKSPHRQGNRFEVGSVKYTPGTGRDSPDFSDEYPFFRGTDGEKTKSSKQGPRFNIELQFGDSAAKFYCRIYYAEQFRNLRKLIFPAGEERFIRSLSRCVPWLARGGKSGSTFCKTHDDRFIVKQMSSPEAQSFLEFAPHYFQYITKIQADQKPTALAKILGVYRIGYRNTQTNTDLKQDLLVMENLFYNRKISQVYDLKGSVRNRLVKTSGKSSEDVVLLDENLLKTSLDSPLYMRWHSKQALTWAITNDTQFLSSHLIMDYSLLVGVDDAAKELVVGIIDYIRTFTWDKKLEMVVKTGVSQLGGTGKMPTVVSPELYRSRFLEAMDRYFLMVPDQWTGLENNWTR